MRLVAADALAAGADTLITSGGVQSNHARVTAAAAAQARPALHPGRQRRAAGPPDRRTRCSIGLLGAEVRYVGDARRARPGDGGARPTSVRRPGGTPVRHPARRLDAARRRGLRPAPSPNCSSRSIRPTSSSTPRRPAARRPASSPAARSPGWHTRVIGISADEPAAVARARHPRASSPGSAPLLGFDARPVRRGARSRSTTRSSASGYGVPTDGVARGDRAGGANRGALSRSDLHGQGDGRPDRARPRAARSRETDTVLFWHTGGQVGLFA